MNWKEWLKFWKVPQMPKNDWKKDLMFWKLDKQKQEKVMKPIKKISNKNKNTRRSLNSEIICEIYKRDWFKCILCWSRELDIPHHVYFWINSEYWEDRNNIEKIVTCCKKCHFNIHHQSWWKDLSEKCIKYIESLYFK